MKKTIGWIIYVIDLIVGFSLFIAAQLEISTNSRYTFHKPLTKYELQVISFKWVGILLIVCGIFELVVKLIQKNYTNKHMQESVIGTVNKIGNICPECALPITVDTIKCPRCGCSIKNNNVTNYQMNGIGSMEKKRFCSNCGNAVDIEQKFCEVCGNKLR